MSSQKTTRRGAADKQTTVPASVAGYIGQLRRALFRLAQANPLDKVGVEVLDDVATVKQCLTEYEQDKLTHTDDRNPLTNRSDGLWKTLDIWTDAWAKDGLTNETVSFFLVTNRECSGSVVRELAFEDRSESDNRNILAELHAQRDPNLDQSGSGIQKLIDKVLDKGDGVLLNVITNVRVTASVEAFGDALIDSTISLLHVSDRIDDKAVYQGLFGWMIDCLMSNWEKGNPGWVEARAFNRQLEAIIVRAKRARVIARAARVIPVSAEDTNSARTHRFVHHLALIEMDDARLDIELIHYVRFGLEKLRLIEEGAILPSDIADRADRLEQRWQHIHERCCLVRAGLTPLQVGWKIYLEAATHREPLAEEPMEEAYMTLGQFHRLADEDRVYWHPDFVVDRAEL